MDINILQSKSNRCVNFQHKLSDVSSGTPSWLVKVWCQHAVLWVK